MNNTGNCKLGMSWVSETLSLVAQPHTEIERWRWQEDTLIGGWCLVIEATTVSVKLNFESADLSQCSVDKAFQAEMVFRLQKVIRLFVEAVVSANPAAPS